MRVLTTTILLSLQLILMGHVTKQENAKSVAETDGEIKRVARSLGGEEGSFNDEEKRVFGSITKPVGKHRSGRQPSTRDETIQVSDIKRDDDSDYYRLLNELMERRIESKRSSYADDIDDANGGDPDDERESMLHLALMQGEQDDDADFDDIFKTNEKRPFGSFTRKLTKRPFGPLTGRFRKRPFGSFTRKFSKRPFGSMTGLPKKRPFGSMISGLSKRPFGSFSARWKKPFEPFRRQRSYIKRDEEEESADDVEKRPFGSFSRPQSKWKRDDDEENVEKRPFGSFTRPRIFQKREQEDGVEKRPFGSFTRPFTRSLAKRPFGSFTRWRTNLPGKRRVADEGLEGEIDTPLYY